MKISSIGKLLLGSVAAAALASGGALAQNLPVATDSQGVPVRDASGNCVLSSGIVHPDCGPKQEAPAPRPAAPASPSAPAAPAASTAPAARPAPASVKQTVVIQADALFDFDKSVVRPDGKKSIDAALGKLAGVDVEMVIATGHTDSVGTDEYNQRLSEQRAANVADYLIDRGVASGSIVVYGYGEMRPKSSNDTAEGRQLNRRVEIHIQAPEGAGGGR